MPGYWHSLLGFTERDGYEPGSLDLDAGIKMRGHSLARMEQIGGACWRIDVYQPTIDAIHQATKSPSTQRCKAGKVMWFSM